MTAIPESQALAYRRLAALIPEAGLLDPCRFRTTWVGGIRSDDCPAHCSGCGGTQGVVPSLAECFYRMVLAALQTGDIHLYANSSDPAAALCEALIAAAEAEAPNAR